MDISALQHSPSSLALQCNPSGGVSNVAQATLFARLYEGICIDYQGGCEDTSFSVTGSDLRAL